MPSIENVTHVKRHRSPNYPNVKRVEMLKHKLQKVKTYGSNSILQQQKQVTSVFPPRCKMPPPLNSRSSTQKAPRDTLVYLRFGSFLRRFFFRYQRIILKKKSQLPLNSRSSTQKAPRDTLVYLRFGSFSRRFFFRYQRIILKSLDFSAQIDFFMNFCPRRATKLRSL